jgi:cytochrome P450
MELFDPHSNEWLLNKFKIYKDLQDRDTAYYSKKYKMYVITRYEDVVYALSNPDLFISGQGNLIVENPRRFGRTLGASDNPTHDTLKNIVKNAYAKHNLERISSLYREKVREELSNKTLINLSEVADQTTAWAIAELLNLPHPKEYIKNLVIDIQRHAPQCVMYNQKAELFEKLIKIVDRAISKNQPAPGPGMYEEYILANRPTYQNGIPYGMSLFTGPTISGASSMTGAIEFMILDLFRENKYQDVLNDPALIPNAVNESLRFNASTGRFRRTVSTSVRLHGIDLSAGDAVALCYDAANRDSTKWDNPDMFDLTRNNTGMAFGHGLHACIALYFSKSLMLAFLEEFINIVGLYKVVTKNEDLQYVMTASGNDDMISNIYIEKIN